MTPVEMRAAEQTAIAASSSARELMECAGSAVAAEILKQWTRRSVLVLCGPGNNGGDGFVVARRLRKAGWPVQIASTVGLASLRGDAAFMAGLWEGDIVTPPDISSLENVGLVVDGLFGTGLSRPLEGELAQLIEKLNALRIPTIAVDLPSGVEGSTGDVRGPAVRATATVAFCRKKPAHLLLPGRAYCGEIVVANIGIPDSVIKALNPMLHENSPRLWTLPRRTLSAHKFDAGHAIVASGGPWSTGAARLAAHAAQRSGAGLVTIASPTAALMVNAAHLTSIMLAEVDSALALAGFLKDPRRNVILLGPALGISSESRAKVRAALASGRATVLDADALTSFEDSPHELFEAIAELPGRPVLMTPHTGEFARLFKNAPEGSKVDKARFAAAASGAIVIYKGADTVIASPAGAAIINANAPAWLATAGSGDVLAGIIAGLLAQAMPPLQAAAAATYIHGEAANRLGAGLIAEDLIGQIPFVLRRLHRNKTSLA
ncbi:MAG TPA: NAD(P)H-hydrate dehydratase [Aestuariivirgaceae bacterium]